MDTCVLPRSFPVKLEGKALHHMSSLSIITVLSLSWRGAALSPHHQLSSHLFEASLSLLGTQEQTDDRLCDVF